MTAYSFSTISTNEIRTADDLLSDVAGYILYFPTTLIIEAAKWSKDGFSCNCLNVFVITNRELPKKHECSPQSAMGFFSPPSTMYLLILNTKTGEACCFDDVKAPLVAVCYH